MYLRNGKGMSVLSLENGEVVFSDGTPIAACLLASATKAGKDQYYIWFEPNTATQQGIITRFLTIHGKTRDDDNVTKVALEDFVYLMTQAV